MSQVVFHCFNLQIHFPLLSIFSSLSNFAYFRERSTLVNHLQLPRSIIIHLSSLSFILPLKEYHLNKPLSVFLFYHERTICKAMETVEENNNMFVVTSMTCEGNLCMTAWRVHFTHRRVVMWSMFVSLHWHLLSIAAGNTPHFSY